MRKIALPRNRRPFTPGEIIREEFLTPLGMTQQQLADALHVDRPMVNALLNGKRSVTARTALLLERALGMSAAFWLGLQQDVDMWDAMHDEKTIRNIRAVRRVAGRGA